MKLRSLDNLAAAFLNLLAEAGGAAGFDVERGLELIDDGEEHGDGADGVGGGGDLLQIALQLGVEDGGSGGKDTPVNGKGQGLPGRGRRSRAAEAAASGDLAGLLGERPHSARQCGQHKSYEEKKGRITLVQRQLSGLEWWVATVSETASNAASAA